MQYFSMDIFEYTFFQNAIVGVLLVSLASAIVGTYIVARRMVFISGGITHACFGGLGLGYFLGMNPIAMAAVFAVASALGVELMSARGKIREDSAIAVVWALGMAVGTLFIFLSPGYVPELTSFLFGNILTITSADITAFAIYAVVLIATMAMLYHRIIACAFDSDFMRTQHAPVTAINCLMTVLVALCIVLTIRLIGIMLLMSLITMPQMVAELFTSRFNRIMAASVVVSVFCSICGLFIAYALNVPASSTIVIVLIMVYCMARMAVAVCRHLRKTSPACHNNSGSDTFK